MPSLTTIREGVQRILENGLDGINVHAKIVDSVTAPAIEIVPTAGVNVAFKRGVVQLDVQLIVTTRGEDGQGQLDDLISGPTNSIPYVIHAHPTAGQNADEDIAADGVSYTIVDQGWSDYRATETEDVRTWKATYSVKVHAEGWQ